MWSTGTAVEWDLRRTDHQVRLRFGGWIRLSGMHRAWLDELRHGTSWRPLVSLSRGAPEVAHGGAWTGREVGPAGRGGKGRTICIVMVRKDVWYSTVLASCTYSRY